MTKLYAVVVVADGGEVYAYGPYDKRTANKFVRKLNDPHSYQDDMASIEAVELKGEAALLYAIEESRKLMGDDD